MLPTKLVPWLISLVILAVCQVGPATAQDIKKLKREFADLRKAAERVDDVRRAAEQGDIDAQITLAQLYAFGMGVPKNNREARRWKRAAAEQGDASSQYSVGLVYKHGHDILEDSLEAMRWFRKAAEQGYSPAQGELAMMYVTGHVPVDFMKSYVWCIIAGAHGLDMGEFKDGVRSNLDPKQVLEAQKIARDLLKRIESEKSD